MGFWAALAMIIYVGDEIRKEASFLKSLSDPQLVQNYIQSLILTQIVEKASSFATQMGTPVDEIKKDDLLEGTEPLLKDEPTLNFSLDQMDPKFERYLERLLRGQVISNSPDPLSNTYKTADPIILYRGEFERQVTDLEVAGAGIDLVFTRTYRSSVGYMGPLGKNWDHSYNLRLREENEFIVIRLTGKLSEELYIKHPRYNESSEFSYFIPPNGVHDVILQDGTGSYILKRPQGIMYRYESTDIIGEHRILQIEDRFGNYLKFMYSADDKLQKILINSAERYVTISYDGSGKINKIEDHAGRSTTYSYDYWDYLEYAIGPSFQSQKPSKQERYEYDPVGRIRKLARVIDGNGNILVENEYDSNEQSEYFGCVIRQIENRGESTFYYENITGEVDPTLPAVDIPTLRVLEYRRNGHEIEHILNIFGNELRTRQQIIDNCTIKEILSRYRYNMDGNIIAQLTPNGVLTQYLYGRDHLIGINEWPEFDPIALDIDINDRMSFSNLLATVVRGRFFNISSDNQNFWDKIPSVKIRDHDEDVVTKYSYDSVSQLPLTRSDTRQTISPDPLHVESAGPQDPTYDAADPRHIAYHRYLTLFEYGPKPRFEVRRTVFPNRSRPSILDGVASVNGITEDIHLYDNNGRLLERVDVRGYTWYDEYYDTSAGPKAGFLRRKVIPHTDWLFNKKTPDILEIQKNGTWQVHEDHISSSGANSDQLIVTIAGVQLTINQSSDPMATTSSNAQVQIRVDGITLNAWNQIMNKTYIVKNLSRGYHVIEFRSINSIPFSVGRIQSHVSLQYEVDNLGRIIREIDAKGNVTANDIDAIGRKTKVISGNPINPSVIHYTYDRSGNLISEREEWRNEDGNAYPEMAITKTYEYDMAGMPILESVGPERGEKRLTKYRYDAEDNLRETADPRGNITYFEYDSMNRHTRIVRGACTYEAALSRTTYDLADNIMAQFDPRGSMYINAYLGPEGEWHSGIDTRGRNTIQTDPMGNLIVNDYDYLDKPIIFRIFQRRNDGEFEMLSRRKMIYDEHSDIILISDYIFDIPIITISPQDNPDKEFFLAMNSGKIIVTNTELHLDAQGNVIAKQNPDSGIHKQSFDGQRRCYDEVDPEGRRIFRIFDGNGNVIRKYTFERVLDPVSGNIMYNEVFIQLKEYNESNLEITRIDPYGNHWKQKYDTLGNKTVTIDPLGSIIKFEYDAFRKEISRKQERTQIGSVGGSMLPPLVTRREYDLNKNLVAIIDPLNKRTEFKYDALDRLIESRFGADSILVKEQIRYDSAGNFVSIIDRNGLIRKMSYDSLNRHIRTDIDTSHISNQNALSSLSATFMSFNYDAAGNLILHQNDYCKVEIQRDSRGLPQYERLQIQNITGAPGRMEISRKFDISGRKSTIIYPSGRKLIYTYDYVGRILSILNQTSPQDYPGSIASATGFTLARFSYIGNRLSSTYLGNGLSSVARYDGRGSLIEQVLTNSGGTTLWRIQQFRDAAGYIRMENTIGRTNSRSRKFTLDSLYRLVYYSDDPINWVDPLQFEPPHIPIDPLSNNKQASINNVISSSSALVGSYIFDYDDLGNRLQTREPGLPFFQSIPNNLDQYVVVSGNSWVYDANGNLRSDRIRLFSYDLNNVLQEIVDIASNTSQVIYYKDAIGRVIAEKTPLDTTFRIYDGSMMLAEISGSGRVEFTAGHMPDQVIHVARSGEDYWISWDRLGSMRALSNNSGSIVSLPLYRPFGSPEDNELSQSPLNFGFSGMWYTKGLPFYHSDRRSYRPDIGRYLQRDPAGLVDGPNVYAYVNNNPINYNDPTGLGKAQTIGWVVKRTGTKLIKTSILFTEKQAARMFGKGFDVLVHEGKDIAKSIARKAIPTENILHHTGHILKSGTTGLSHFQNSAFRGAQSRHIFYGMIGAFMLGNEAFAEELGPDSVDIKAIYSFADPGVTRFQSISRSLTVSHYVEEGSWLSNIDIFNPFDYLTMSADVDRDIEIYESRELIGINVTIKHNSEPVTTYSIDLNGNLHSVTRWVDGNIQSTVSGDEFLKNIEDPAELDKIVKEFQKAVNK